MPSRAELSATHPCRGCARRQAEGLTPAASYSGTIKFASNAVLAALRDGAQVDSKPADDLQSLVSEWGSAEQLNRSASVRRLSAPHITMTSPR